jgi:hypothetical protein
MITSGKIVRPTVNTIAITTNPVPASALVNSEILNTGAVGNISLTLPSAAGILAAFAAEGVVLNSGNTFDVKITAAAAHSITVLPSATVTTMSGSVSFVLAASRAGLLTFRVLDSTASSESMEFRGVSSN